MSNQIRVRVNCSSMNNLRGGQKRKKEKEEEWDRWEQGVITSEAISRLGVFLHRKTHLILWPNCSMWNEKYNFVRERNVGNQCWNQEKAPQKTIVNVKTFVLVN